MFENVVDNAKQNQMVSYSSVAAFAFLVWEHWITFADEIDFIWSGTKCSLTKLAFLVLRYTALVATFFIQSSGTGLCEKLEICVPPHCLAWFAFQVASLAVIIALQQFIMASRVYALYGCSLKIVLVLATSILIEHALTISFTVIYFQHIEFNDICISTEISLRMLGIGIPHVLCDLFLLVLTVYKCIQTAPRSDWRRMPLVWVLFFDGSWAFALVFGVFCLESFIFFAFRGPIIAIIWPWQYALSSFAACRVVLRVHREAANPPSSALRGLDIYVGGSGPHRRHRDGLPVEPEGFALTTFLPGMEFEEREPPDKWGGGLS